MSNANDEPTKRYLPEKWILPELTEQNRAFFTAGRLTLQQCESCRAIQHPPGEFCFDCQCLEFRYVEVQPQGVVVARTVVHHAVHPMLKDAVPYNAVVVELETQPGLRLVGNVVGALNDEITIGMRVQATFAQVTPDDDDAEHLTLLQWVPLCE